MENVSNVSSEQELLQLRNEGKISEDEYAELLETLRKTAMLDIGIAVQDKHPLTRTSGLAIASLILAISLGPLGFLPAVICGYLALRKIKKDLTLQGRGLAIAGLIVAHTVFSLSIIFLIPTIVLPMLAHQKAAIQQRITFETIEIKRFPLDDTEGLITKNNVQIDKQSSSDGNGCLRIEATRPITVRLFETGDIDIEDARLIYQARVRTENIEGQVYLEMWCHFAGRGEFFSRDLATPLSKTT